jgi:hypothetical protein
MTVLIANSVALFFFAAYFEKKFRQAPIPRAPQNALDNYSRTHSRGPLLCLITMLVMLPFTAYWYGRNEARNVATWTLTQPTEAPAYQPAFINELTKKMLRYTDGWSAKWQTDNARSFHAFYLDWEKGKSPPDNMNVHTPGGCLINLGIELMEEYPNVNLDLQGHQMPMRFLRFRDHGRPLYMLYFVSENKVLGEAADVGSFDFSYQKRLRSVIAGRRNPGQKLLEIGLWDEVDPTLALGHLTDYLKHHLTWTQE